VFVPFACAKLDIHGAHIGRFPTSLQGSTTSVHFRNLRAAAPPAAPLSPVVVTRFTNMLLLRARVSGRQSCSRARSC
jgi:hypothetical protein